MEWACENRFVTGAVEALNRRMLRARDAIDRAYETFKAKGVEISDDLTERDYGTDFGVRDRFGNHLRIVQLVPTSPQLGARKVAEAKR